MKKITKYIVLLSALGGCWAFVFNPNGILDVVGNKWPTIGSSLPAIGAAAAVLFGFVFSLLVVHDLLERQSTRRNQENQRKYRKQELEKLRIINNLHDLQGLIGSFDVDMTNNARSNAIIRRLVHDGILPADLSTLEVGRAHEYIAHLAETVEQSGVEFAKTNRADLLSYYVQEEQDSGVT